MGYLLTTASGLPVKSITVTIPEADVQLLGTTPYTLVAAGSGINYIPISAYFIIGRNTTPYSGFSHVYLGDNATIQYGILEIANVGGNLQQVNPYIFALNMSHPPNRFGIRVSSNKPIQIYFNAPATAGDGDMTVTIYYLEVLDI